LPELDAARGFADLGDFAIPRWLRRAIIVFPSRQVHRFSDYVAGDEGPGSYYWKKMVKRRVQFDF
jgi:hypothetical protein